MTGRIRVSKKSTAAVDDDAAEPNPGSRIQLNQSQESISLVKQKIARAASQQGASTGSLALDTSFPGTARSAGRTKHCERPRTKLPSVERISIIPQEIGGHHRYRSIIDKRCRIGQTIGSCVHK